METIDLFMKSKSEKESQWAMQEVEDVSGGGGGSAVSPLHAGGWWRYVQLKEEQLLFFPPRGSSCAWVLSFHLASSPWNRLNLPFSSVNYWQWRAWLLPGFRHSKFPRVRVCVPPQPPTLVRARRVLLPFAGYPTLPCTPWSSPSTAAAAGEPRVPSIEDPDDLDTSGIEEELAARMARPDQGSRSSRSSSAAAAAAAGPGPRPGPKPAVEADRPLEGGAAGLIGAAPDMAKVRARDGGGGVRPGPCVEVAPSRNFYQA